MKIGLQLKENFCNWINQIKRKHDKVLILIFVDERGKSSEHMLIR